MAVTPLRRFLLPALLCLAAPPLAAQDPVSASAEGVNVNLVNVDLRSAVQMLAQYVDAPMFFSTIGDHRVTFTSGRPVARQDVLGIIRNLVAQFGYVVEQVEGGSYTIRAAQQPQQPAAPVQTAFPVPGGPGGGSLASANGMELFVIRLRHARAADVAATVNLLYGRGGAVGEIGSQRRGTLNDQLNANRVSPYGEQPPQVTAGGTPSGSFGGEVVIVPDFRTNSLLVRAARADYELIRAAVEQVDVRPLQVLIQATVAYVSRDFTLEYGLDASTESDARLPGSRNTRFGGQTVGSDATDLVIRALNVGGIDLNLILRAGESRNNVVILDRPIILAANNEEAEIVVGEQRPFVQVQRSTDGGVLDEVVQYKDVGTSLRVLPTISADGFVQLQVTQEVNSASEAAVGTINAPVINTRSVSTELLVRDGYTAVLGGLSGSERNRTSGGIPFLSDIPLIGGIFGRKLRSNDEFELFVFITPHVIYSDEDMQDAAEQVRTRRNMRRALGKQPELIRAAPADSAQSPAALPAQPGQPVAPQSQP
ncbi:type II secretion system protein GspD [Longimicrobium sp.]|uniref:type II secretion system protein GspD n=1 Tax=Longimicrobium sp. TaxID=2029185 RepID=UPI002E36E293|nr:secretin N-terminal domain-containing protein [Longimicrobium sp.]HEX6042292.1 secretin N-terminal domain-containing protein [Longimicrobium sp.]